MRRLMFMLSVVFLLLGIFSDKLPVVVEPADFSEYTPVVTQGSSDTPDVAETYRIWGIQGSFLSADEAALEARKMFWFLSLVFFVVLMTVLKNTRRA